MDRVRAVHGDSRDVLKTFEGGTFDSVVTDPPYALVSIVKRFGKPGSAPAKGNDAYMRASAGFMNCSWDVGDTAFDPIFWGEVLRVVKPGAHVCAFGGTRSYHRLVCAIEDAGFEIRDSCAFLYGSGFPKSKNIGNGLGTALKPAMELICIARKPIEGTVAQNYATHGVGAINVDGCRVEIEALERDVIDTRSGAGQSTPGWGHIGIRATGERYKSHTQGRWPANVIHDGSEEVVGAFPETHSAGSQRDGGAIQTNDGGQFGIGNHPKNGTRVGDDSGSAARFFYTAKADSDDRIGSKHPTVKPIDLMQYLVRLVTPKGGLVLDPFAGTGTTGEACFREGMRAILIERETQYFADIQRRLRLLNAGPDERQRESIKASGKVKDAGPLFA